MRIAITGGIGEGKSTVLALIRDLGIETASADEIAREVFNRPSVNARLAEAAGLPLPLQAADLRNAIAANPDVRAAVNRITHPLIHAEILASPAPFIEVPLIIETCMQHDFDQVWVVTCGPREQFRRLMTRYGDAAAVKALLATQLPTRVKIAFADRLIRTNSPLESVTHLVSVAVKALRF